MTTEKHLGFVGIGRMGTPIAERLLEAGYTLTVYDTQAPALQALAAKGAHIADSPKAVADRAETVLVSLPTPDIVLAVALGEDGLARGSAVRTVIDLSTSGSQAARTLADGLAAQNIASIDCPVSGGVTGAKRGTLALMVSGPRERYDALHDMFGVIGKPVYVGERAGMAQTMKVINNLISVTALSITSELMVMGVKAGLDPDIMLQVINSGSGRTNASEDKIPRFVLTRSFDFGFAIGLSAKDVRLCLEESEQLGVPLRVGDAARRLLNDARDKFGNDADLTEIIRYVEDNAGVQVRGKAADAA
ncbi:NAD(P)-dependent oxidoreductase [Bordetella bronchiseptica]|uniref:2-hydroxy-3-oxopropionate reductase n=1 Tax=Bordetella bronchiseptica (strain ATCC BAA-588 / NCTC 13252 / RB50) TaxID=257310 RepID=A0A0H3LQ73_BORBR|nr:NAD(P)-dependent oxidoreductase [Bordetella bronchiseptica]KAK62934.1 NADP oxidoreductase coenzyme F420-dependent [Bordetella bronchiseptica 980-2]AUV49990.1 NAD(P)-dependent oxidoreductase [Bordetella bronchiseptica]AWP81448.1 oxidoreductase [Bordetella bronchiseptica]AWP86245.1 oxidoreductase [Bordetella bronchiseptica]AWQ11818.1 oxidoreductase [Bordetella bronchiseptica]